MDNFNHGFTSVANSSFNDAGRNNENELTSEMASKLKSPNKKQLPTKNFMSPTISAAIKANNVPKKKILAEKNETLDVVEQTCLLRSSSFCSKPVKSPVIDADDDLDKSSLQPYDPVKNYLSPRPKFLRYNPNRRRKILGLQENEDSVRSSASFDAGNGISIPSSELELGLGLGSSGSKDSCSQKESAEETSDLVNEEFKGEDDDDDDEECEGDDDGEMVEFRGNRGWIWKGILKFVVVVIAVILSTQAICSMNYPTHSQNSEAVWGLNNWYDNVGLNVSEAVCDSRFEADLVEEEKLKEEEFYHDYKGLNMIEELVEVQNAQIDDDDVYEEVENDDTDVTQDEMLSNEKDTDELQQIKIAAAEVMEIDELEVETESYDQLLRADFNQDEDVGEEDDSDAIEKKPQLSADAECEIAEEKEIDDVLIKFESFDLTLAVLIMGLLTLILTSFSVIYHSNQTKSSSPVLTTVVQEAEKEEIKNVVEPSRNLSLIQPIDDQEPLVKSASLVQKDVTKEISSSIHAPSVELLGELVFGEEVTSSIRSYTNNVSATNSLIQQTTTLSSHMETSTADSHTVKKQRRKTPAEASSSNSIVTPSPVRRSSRLQKRSVMSP